MRESKKVQAGNAAIARVGLPWLTPLTFDARGDAHAVKRKAIYNAPPTLRLMSRASSDQMNLSSGSSLLFLAFP